MMLASLCFIWLGMLLGVSFLAIPVKFTVADVPLLANLEIGQHIFATFDRVEIGLALAICLLLLLSHSTPAIWLPLAGAFCSVALQTAWLLPAMDRRIAVLMSGEVPPPAPYHSLYVVLELFKLLCLIIAGAGILRALKNTAAPRDITSPHVTATPTEC